MQIKMLDTNRRDAGIDLGVALAFMVVSLAVTPVLTPVFRQLSGIVFVITLAVFQFASEGLAPLILMVARRERFADFGFTWRKAGTSVALALLLAVIYDLAVSFHAASWLWIPLRRHNAVRNSLALGFPLSFVGLAIIVAVWGFFEAFFGVYFSRKINQLLAHDGNGWLAPGVLGFAVFNGLIHAAIGQGFAGFLTSFASGYGIAVIPAVTKNAWGSSVFQTATNAVGTL